MKRLGYLLFAVTGNHLDVRGKCSRFSTRQSRRQQLLFRHLLFQCEYHVVLRMQPVRIINDGDFADYVPGHEGAWINGTLWAAIYVFDDSQEMRSCCACQITADGLLSESVNKELTANEFTGRGEMTRGVIKVVSSISPDPTSPLPAIGLRGWATHVQATTTTFPAPGPGNPVNAVEKGPWFVTEDALADSNPHGTRTGQPGDPVFLWANHWQRLRTLPLHAGRLRLLVIQLERRYGRTEIELRWDLLPHFLLKRLGVSPSRFVVCRACSTAWRWKSSTQPDGGEGLAKRKGVVARRGLKEAWSKGASR